MLTRLSRLLRNWLDNFSSGGQEAANASAPPVANATPPGVAGTAAAAVAPPVVPPATAEGTTPPSAEETAAAQSILDNESLTADLDDEAADTLLEWGVANARTIARSISGLMEGGTTEETLSERLRALRQMMRSVNNYVAGQQLDGQGQQLLDKILEQAAVVYGKHFTPPSAAQRTEFITTQRHFLHNPAQLVANLRRFIENPDTTK